MSREGVIYTHYGHKSFDTSAFEPIRNMPMSTKPFGGLWASANDAEFGWKKRIDDNNKIQFKLKPEARILELHSIEDARQMQEKYMTSELSRKAERVLLNLDFIHLPLNTLDFEAIAQDYDAIEFFSSDDAELYRAMSPYDRDSVLVMNKDVVAPIEERN